MLFKYLLKTVQKKMFINIFVDVGILIIILTISIYIYNL